MRAREAQGWPHELKGASRYGPSLRDFTRPAYSPALKRWANLARPIGG